MTILDWFAVLGPIGRELRQFARRDLARKCEQCRIFHPGDPGGRDSIRLDLKLLPRQI